MGNTVDKMRQRELERRESKREQLVAFVESSRRRQSLLEFNGHPAGDDAQNPNLPENERQLGFARAQMLGEALDDDGDHRLTDRDREAWLYRMENEALEVINDNMELQEERRRERERREERREELENMGMDGGGLDQGDDPNAHRDDQPENRSPPSSRQSSLVASDDEDDDDDDDDFEDEVADDDDGYDMDDDAGGNDDYGEDDAASEGGQESDRGEPESAAAEEAGGGDDEELRRDEY